MRAFLQLTFDILKTGRGGLGLLALFALLLLTVGSAPTAEARMQMSDGTGFEGPGGGLEGDPLDGNDTNNGGDDIVHQRREVPEGIGGDLWPLVPGLAIQQFEPVFVDGRVRFIMIVSPLQELAPEALYVR